MSSGVSGNPDYFVLRKKSNTVDQMDIEPLKSLRVEHACAYPPQGQTSVFVRVI